MQAAKTCSSTASAMAGSPATGQRSGPQELQKAFATHSHGLCAGLSNGCARSSCGTWPAASARASGKVSA